MEFRILAFHSLEVLEQLCQRRREQYGKGKGKGKKYDCKSEAPSIAPSVIHSNLPSKEFDINDCESYSNKW